MLELASQSGFRECAQHYVSTPGLPGDVEGGGFFDALGRNAGYSERLELSPETESVPASLCSRENGPATGTVGLGNDAPGHHGRPSVLWETHNSLMQNILSVIALLGQEPEHASIHAMEGG
jgi:hypothetical protein